MKPYPARSTTRAVLAAAATFAVGAAATAQTDFGLIADPMPQDVEFELDTSALIFETGDTDNGFDVSLDLFQTSGRFRVPGDDEFILRQAQARFGFDYTHLYLDTADPVLPENLVDVSLGYGMGVYQSEDETIVAGVTVGIGYAGAGAFDDGNAYYGLANFVLGKEFQEDGKFFKAGDRFGLVISYDGNRVLFPDIPLPGFQYTRPITEELELSVGFPFSSVRWRPDERWEFTLNYLIPDAFTGRVDYGFREGIGVFAEVAGQSEAFHADQLPNANDRIIFRQSRVEGGIRYRVQDTQDYRVNVILAAGFAFNTEFDVGFDVRDDNTVAELSDEPYLRAAVELRF
ncbi:MAG: hypothetical protein AAF743_11360 [Planctomycetota bacterium]